uniref:F-box domain-containing protein n=1 Tax=Oryza barthii TaxID=65489 RepID=A0A0D3GKS6_9ORYZ
MPPPLPARWGISGQGARSAKFSLLRSLYRSLVAYGDKVPAPLQQLMENMMAAKRSWMEHHRVLSDDSSFHMEDLPEQQPQLMENVAVAKRSRLEQHRTLSDNSFRVEDLPEEIQSLLLSLLSLKEAASTSIVSRNWRKLWTRYPNLCFDGSKDGPADMDSVKIERMKFIDTVNSIIQQHSGIGLNKFSIRCNLLKDDSDILDRWIRFATASKAKIIDMNLCTNRNNKGPTKHLYDFPLEAFGDQDIPFIQCLFLNNVSIKPHSDIGFTKLRSLHLHCVQIIGDLSGLLFNCSSLEDLEVFACLGVTALNIPHQLNKLRHLLICNMRIQMLEFHVPGLSHFEYKGTMIPIMLHGCSKLQKATLNFHQTWLEEDNNKVLGHVFHGIPSVSAVEVLNILVDICTKQSVWSSQVHTLTARPTIMFMNLKHLTYEILIFTKDPNSHSGVLQLAQYLAFAPQLETLELHMLYHSTHCRCWHEGAGVSYGHIPHHHLKTVYMSGFRCYRAQVELLFAILEMGDELEHVTIDPMTRVPYSPDLMNLGIPEDEICQWANRTSQRFGKAISVVKPP